MLIVKEDKTRPLEQGQIFVELTKNRESEIANCDRLGYWCDKAHLRHFILELNRVLSNEEFSQIVKNKIIKNVNPIEEAAKEYTLEIANQDYYYGAYGVVEIFGSRQMNVVNIYPSIEQAFKDGAKWAIEQQNKQP